MTNRWLDSEDHVTTTVRTGRVLFQLALGCHSRVSVAVRSQLDGAKFKCSMTGWKAAVALHAAQLIWRGS